MLAADFPSALDAPWWAPYGPNVVINWLFRVAGVLTLRNAARICFVLLLLSTVGCASRVRHAPGYSARSTMELQRAEFTFGKNKPCYRGDPCDLSLPDGSTFAFSNVDTDRSSLSEFRPQFDVEYRGSRARCATKQDSAVFACSIVPAEEPGVAYELEVQPRCMSGRLVRRDAGSETVSRLETDAINVLGMHTPFREVALLDESGPVVSSDSGHFGGHVDLYTRRNRPVRPSELLAVVAFQSMLRLDGRPLGCI